MAYVRILPPGVKYPEVTFGRVLTMKEYRGCGIGKKLMKECLLYVKRNFKGGDIKISAQQYLEKFYSDFGFETVSEPYMEEGILHIQMITN